MKAKSGKKIEAIKPQKAAEVFEADDAKPGQIAEIKAVQKTEAAGKYGQTKLPAHKPAASESAPASQKNKVSATSKDAAAQPADSSSTEEKTGWINIKLVDEKGNAVAGETYEIVLPDGTLAKGTLGIDGTAKVKDFDEGSCIVSFPKLVKGSVSKK